jgi:NADH-quinone oxidoreductase subunit H
MNQGLDALVGFIKAVFVIGAVLQVVPLLIYLERKICAYVQMRLGPNRVNLSIPVGVPLVGGMRLIPGSLQPLADAIKLAFKEEIIPRDADKLLWYLGPLIAFLPIGAALAFIPFGIGGGVGQGWDVFGSGYVVDFRVAAATGGGILMLFAVSSLGVYGIAAGGWGSGSKFPLMGAVRGAAQMISYEIPMGLALLAAMATLGTLDTQQMVHEQATGHFLYVFPNWLVFKQPLAAFIFLVAMFAENNRLPFDLPEAEPELVGGYHTEYSGLKFALFFLGEYAAMILMCSIFVTLFMGGWALELPLLGYLFEDAPGQFPYLLTVVDPAGTGGFNALLSMLVFGGKVFLLLNFQLWIRWTLPRFRYDQLMNLGWKVMVPLALLNLVVTGVVLTLIGE